jgi:hypothetical protein
MKMPGFSAEAALSRTTTGYRLTSGATMRSGGGGVIASRKSMAVKAGCGACSELKWPNGTGTGACMQNCCDLLGNCKFQACPCGGGSGVAFGGGGVALRSF